MNKIVGFGLAAAAVVVVVIVGSQLFGSAGGLGAGPTPTPEPTATPEPSMAEPSSSAATGLPVGSSFTLVTAEGPLESSIHATIPAPGWWDDGGTLTNTGDGTAPDGGSLEPDGAYIFGTWIGEPLIPSDPCQWASTMPDTPATTLEEIAAGLASQATRDASTPVDVTADGHPGTSITLHVPGDIAYSANEFTDCDEGKFCTLGFAAEATCYMWYQGPDEFQEIWIIDVDGEFYYMTGNYWPGTPPEVVEEVGAILGSMTFGE